MPSATAYLVTDFEDVTSYKYWTPPANGYFRVGVEFSSTTATFAIVSASNLIGYIDKFGFSASWTRNQPILFTIPCLKGKQIGCGITNCYFKNCYFVYTQGEIS